MYVRLQEHCPDSQTEFSGQLSSPEHESPNKVSENYNNLKSTHIYHKSNIYFHPDYNF